MRPGFPQPSSPLGLVLAVAGSAGVMTPDPALAEGPLKGAAPLASPPEKPKARALPFLSPLTIGLPGAAPFSVDGKWLTVRPGDRGPSLAIGGRVRQSSGTLRTGCIQAAWVINGDGPAHTIAPTHGSEFAILGGVKAQDGQRLSNGGIGGREYDGMPGLDWHPDGEVRLMADSIRAHAGPAAQSLGDDGNADSGSVVGRLRFYR